MTEVQRGFQTHVDTLFDPSKDISLTLSVDGPDGYDIRCLGLDSSGAPAAEAWMLRSGGTDASPGGEIVLRSGFHSSAFTFNLARIPDGIDRLAFVVSVGLDGGMDRVHEMSVVVVQGGRQIMMDLSGGDMGGEPAITAAEVRRQRGAWHLGFVASPHKGGLRDILGAPSRASAPHPEATDVSDSSAARGDRPRRLSLEKTPLAAETSAPRRPAPSPPDPSRPDPNRPDPGPFTAGQSSASQSWADQTPPGPSPSSQSSAGRSSAGQSPTGPSPASQPTSSQTPPGPSPAGQSPPGPSPAGQTPPSRPAPSPGPSQPVRQPTAEEVGRLAALAAGGDHDAELAYGMILREGAGGAPPDPKAAADMLRRSAEGGVAEGMRQLGRLLCDRGGGAYDPLVGVGWLEKSASSNRLSSAQLGAALSDLGAIHKSGLAVPQNLGKAFGYFQKSADLGDPLGRLNLAWCYLNGEGVQRDYGRGKVLIRELRRSPIPRIKEKVRQVMEYHRNYEKASDLSHKNFALTAVLCVLIGFYGIHRLYAGKYVTGVLMFFTLGYYGVGWVIDLFALFTGRFTDNRGLLIKRVRGLRGPEFALASFELAP